LVNIHQPAGTLSHVAVTKIATIPKDVARGEAACERPRPPYAVRITQRLGGKVNTQPQYFGDRPRAMADIRGSGSDATPGIPPQLSLIPQERRAGSMTNARGPSTDAETGLRPEFLMILLI
jgi:hypothetical protein